MNPKNCLRMVAALGLLVVFLFAGCSRSKEPPAPVSGAASGAPGEAALTVLAKADAADGTVDKVVTKCAVCMLGMDGTPEHAASYGEYRLHFCSEYCRESFTKEPEKALLALKFPGEQQ